MKPRHMTLLGMIGMAAVARLLPHPWNATPVAAMALFAGAHFRRPSVALAVPLLAMLASDFVLGFHALMLPVYGSLALTVFVGAWVQQRYSAGRIAAGALTGSLLFFAVTNFAVWLTSGMYPLTVAGLEACYVAALPFFRHTLAGDLVFTAVLFGAFHLAERMFPVLKERPARA